MLLVWAVMLLTEVRKAFESIVGVARGHDR